MRAFVLAGVAGLLTMLGVISPSMASASLLPGTAATKITGSSSKVTFQVKGGAAFTCSSSTTTGEVKSSEESLVLVAISGCATAGLPINSTGDAAKTILMHAEGTTCHDAAKNQYLLLALLPTKIEVAATKTTLELTGGLNLKIEPAGKKAKEFSAQLSQKEGKQEIGPSECENSKKEARKNVFLSTSTNGGTAIQTGEETAEGKLIFSAEEEFMS